MPEFAPLVDLAKTTMSDLLEASVGDPFQNVASNSIYTER